MTLPERWLLSIPCRPRYSARPETEQLAHYVITRRDLPLGVLAANLVHAAGESSPGRLPSGTFAIALAVNDEAELAALEVRLRAAGLKPHAVREDDPPWCGSLMAIGVPPGARSAIRRYLSSIPLLKDVKEVRPAAA